MKKISIKSLFLGFAVIGLIGFLSACQKPPLHCKNPDGTWDPACAAAYATSGETGAAEAARAASTASAASRAASMAGSRR